MTNHTPAQPRPRELLSIGARYLIDPSSQNSNLQLDAACLLEASTASVQALIDGLSVTAPMRERPEQVVAMLYGLRYQLEMASNIVDAIKVTP
ncbi:MAG: hypothetical protein ACTHNM_06775 [Dyella sp.]|uniref:hypothetical protein n=1 Tax=Dyella sp. TaxID=1869338 RepID=UPI003F7E5A49